MEGLLIIYRKKFHFKYLRILLISMIKEKVLGSTTAENEFGEFENNPVSVKLTAESRIMLDDIVNYLQINQSNAVRMAISKLHKDIIP